MNIEYISIDDIHQYELNAKKHSETQINNVAESIKQFGFRQPIVVDKDHIIIIGHCRYLASLKLGLREIPCVVADDLTDEQTRKLRLLDNKLNESEWDLESLKLEIDNGISDLTFEGFDVEFPVGDIEVNDETNIPDLESSEKQEREVECPFCGEKFYL